MNKPNHLITQKITHHPHDTHPIPLMRTAHPPLLPSPLPAIPSTFLRRSARRPITFYRCRRPARLLPPPRRSSSTSTTRRPRAAPSPPRAASGEGLGGHVCAPSPAP